MICFQHGSDGGSQFTPETARSWCALFPLTAGPHTPAEENLRLANHKATLLDLDQRAPVNATRHPHGHWEVRPLEGPGLLIGTPHPGWKPGYAEAVGLLPLIIPRPGRTTSPYAQALGPRHWSVSKSIQSIKTSTEESTRWLPLEALATATVLVVGVAILVLVDPENRFPGLLLALSAIIWSVRLGSIWSGLTAWRRIDRASTPAAVPIDLDWRPADEGGSLAWILIADDAHQRLEAPIKGLHPNSIESFPTTAHIHGELAPGAVITAKLADQTTLTTIRPLASPPPQASLRSRQPPQDTRPTDR